MSRQKAEGTAPRGAKTNEPGTEIKVQGSKFKDQRPWSAMQLARVIGTVVATVKNESLAGRKLLVVQTLDKNLESIGKPMVAVDAAGAGVGELVFWCRGKEASFPFKREDTPTDCTIVGIVDSDSHVTR